MKRIGTLTAALVVTAGIACQPASASTATAPGIDYVPVRDAASEELVTVDTVGGDVDGMLAPRGFDLDYLVSRDAASELDLTGGDTNALLVGGWIDDNALDTPRIVSFVGDDGGGIDEMLAPRGFDFDYIVSRDAASEDLMIGDTNAVLLGDWIDDNALDTPRIVSFVGDDGGDIDEMFATRGFDFDYLISRDAAGWDE